MISKRVAEEATIQTSGLLLIVIGRVGPKGQSGKRDSCSFFLRMLQCLIVEQHVSSKKVLNRIEKHRRIRLNSRHWLSESDFALSPGLLFPGSQIVLVGDVA